jgi:glycosyltransferase involved in cell wall biosynthesis
MAPSPQLALLDARLGRKITGIGHYVVNLARQLGRQAPDSVSVICNLQHRRRFRAMGLGTASVLPRREVDPARLPASKIVHGPNFHAPDLPGRVGVSTFHDLGYLRLPECHPPGMPEELDRLIRGSLAHTGAVICVSRSALEDFVETYDVAEDRCHVIHLGVAPRWFDAPSAEARDGVRRRHDLHRPFLLHVGAMIPRKDIVTLLEAFRLLAGQRPELELVVAGNKTKRWASDWPKVQEWLQAHPGEASKVRILDYVADGDLPALYRESEACVSTTLWEGFGLTVLEAFASETPVVSSDVGSIPEIGGDIVRYGTPRQPETYAEAIAAALDDPDRDARVARGRDHARTFTWERTGEQTLEVYRQAAA